LSCSTSAGVGGSRRNWGTMSPPQKASAPWRLPFLKDTVGELEAGQR